MTCLCGLYWELLFLLCSQTKNSRIKKAVLLWSDNRITEILWCLKKKKEPNKRSHRHLRHPLHTKHCRTKGYGCPGCLLAQRRSGMIPTNRLWQWRTQLLRFELFRLHAALPWKHLGYAEQGVYICCGEAADDFSLLWPRRWQYREKWQLSCWAGYTLWLGNEKRADTAPLHAQAQCLLFLASRPVVLSHSLLFLLHTSQTWHDWACLPGQSQSITHTCLWLEKHRNPSLQFGRRCFTRCYLVIKQCCDCSCWVCDFYLS